MTGSERSEREWEQAAQWAERAMRLPADSRTARRGEAAARAGRRMLARAEAEPR
ncbi:hypothetical protein [Prescottella equi]